MKTSKHPVIQTREDLQQEERRLRLLIKTQETALRERVQQMPGEMLYAGVNAVLPAVLTGKISNTILGAAKNFINRSVVNKTGGNSSRLVTAAKQAGIFTLFKIAFRAFIKRAPAKKHG